MSKHLIKAVGSLACSYFCIAGAYSWYAKGIAHIQAYYLNRGGNAEWREATSGTSESSSLTGQHSTFPAEGENDAPGT